MQLRARRLEAARDHRRLMAGCCPMRSRQSAALQLRGQSAGRMRTESTGAADGSCRVRMRRPGPGHRRTIATVGYRLEASALAARVETIGFFMRRVHATTRCDRRLVEWTFDPSPLLARRLWLIALLGGASTVWQRPFFSLHTRLRFRHCEESAEARSTAGRGSFAPRAAQHSPGVSLPSAAWRRSYRGPGWVLSLVQLPYATPVQYDHFENSLPSRSHPC